MRMVFGPLLFIISTSKFFLAMLTRNAWVPELGVVLKKGGLYSLKGLTY
jgi:hypothetical protein